jgi:hypothetical protein
MGLGGHAADHDELDPPLGERPQEGFEVST